jgi:hypothetical protein
MPNGFSRARGALTRPATKIEMIINLRTAKALGRNVPDRLLALADQVIE